MKTKLIPIISMVASSALLLGTASCRRDEVGTDDAPETDNTLTPGTTNRDTSVESSATGGRTGTSTTNGGSGTGTGTGTTSGGTGTGTSGGAGTSGTGTGGSAGSGDPTTEEPADDVVPDTAPGR
jgi:hypothetical protein